jgi:outer membrane immunogenic protein
MKKLLLAGIAAVAFSAARVFAADMPVKAPMEMSNWTGFYLGGVAGIDWGQTQHFNETILGGSGNGQVSGYTLGGTYGYNLQAAQWVYGLEGDYSRHGTLQNTFASENGFCPGPAVCTTELKWLGTDRVRAGYLFTPNNLIYATGGVAYGSVRAGLNGFNDLEDRTRVGWAAGAGIEGKLATPGWTMKIEYLWVDLGGKTNYVFIGDNERVSLKDNMIRLGFNYKFGN